MQMAPCLRSILTPHQLQKATPQQALMPWVQCYLVCVQGHTKTEVVGTQLGSDVIRDNGGLFFVI